VRKDEAKNRYGRIQRVKYRGSMRGIGIGNYYLCYDENEVYHIEDGINRNVVKAFSCNSWDMAMQFAKAYLEVII
jgi:hypothetical protein